MIHRHPARIVVGRTKYLCLHSNLEKRDRSNVSGKNYSSLFSFHSILPFRSLFLCQDKCACKPTCTTVEAWAFFSEPQPAPVLMA